MPIRYHKDTDILSIVFEPPLGECLEFEAHGFSVLVDEADAVAEIEIQDARRFLERVFWRPAFRRRAGVEAPKTVREAVWEDVDSSMISAFKYDELESTLEVAFTRTGVYCYFDVPSHIVEGLRNADSKGSYMRNMIIDMYHWTKL